MSEGTFRAVVATVLVGALVLVSVLVFAVLPQNPAPSPMPTAAQVQTAQPSPTPTPGLVFAVDVTTVGRVPKGGASRATLVLRFVEPSVAAIPSSAGSFTVTLTDRLGAATTVAFTGTPSLEAPGSLGASAELVAPNRLMVSIVASDPLNIEPITVTGLGIAAAPGAAFGAINATLGSFSGSLAGGVASSAALAAGDVID